MLPKLVLLYTSPEQALAEALKRELERSQTYASVEKVALGEKENPSSPGHANIALLLLSESFLQAEIEQDPFLDEMLSRATEEDFLLVAVIAAECEWEDSPYSGLALLPEARVSLDQRLFWGGEEKALAAIQSGLQVLLKDWSARRTDLQAYWKARLTAGPSAFRLALRLAWRITPRRVKWGLAGLLMAILSIIIWLSLS